MTDKMFASLLAAGIVVLMALALDSTRYELIPAQTVLAHQKGSNSH